MRSFRKNRRPGNRPPTREQAIRIANAKTFKCIPCLVWAESGKMPMEWVAVVCDYDHAKSGNIRRGHGDGYGGCLWHHRGRTEDHERWPLKRLREIFGPSKMDGSKLYHDAYGSEDELIARQTVELEAQ